MLSNDRLKLTARRPLSSYTMLNMRDVVMNLFSAEHGHFLLESGYHASMWLDLETLFIEPARIDPLAAELANRLSMHKPEIICGPLVEGAFLALSVARHLGVPFTYSERSAGVAEGLYPYTYSLPVVLRPYVVGKRVAIVNDVISAGSAVRGTATDLERCGAVVAAVAALLVLGEWMHKFATQQSIPVETLAQSPFDLSTPDKCSLCREAVPLQRRVQST